MMIFLEGSQLDCGMNLIPFFTRNRKAMIVDDPKKTVCNSRNLSIFICPARAGKYRKVPQPIIINVLSVIDNHASALNHWLAVIIDRRKTKREVNTWIRVT